MAKKAGKTPATAPAAAPAASAAASGLGPGALPGARRGMWLAQHTLLGQGAQLGLAAPQLGGTTVRVTLPRPVRSAA